MTRFARLGEGDEFQIGRFVIGCTYPYPSDNDGQICFDDVPRPVPMLPSQDSSTNSVRRPIEMMPAPARRATPKTDFDVEVPPPGRNEPTPTDWNAEDDTDQIHRPGAPRAARPLSDAEFALLVPVDELGHPDSGAVAANLSNAQADPNGHR